MRKKVSIIHGLLLLFYINSAKIFVLFSCLLGKWVWLGDFLI